MSDSNLEISSDGKRDERQLPSGRVPVAFPNAVIATSVWIVIGISIIYGGRLWWDSPIDPSFVPFACVCFGTVVSFAVVVSLSKVNGTIEFEAPGFKFKGASGPIILWVMCFIAILFGFHLVGIEEVFKMPLPKQVPIQNLWKEQDRIDLASPLPPLPTTSGPPDHNR